MSRVAQFSDLADMSISELCLLCILTGEYKHFQEYKPLTVYESWTPH